MLASSKSPSARLTSMPSSLSIETVPELPLIAQTMKSLPASTVDHCTVSQYQSRTWSLLPDCRRLRHRESGRRHQLNMMQPSLPTLRLRAQSCSANAICTSSRLVQQEKIRHSGQPVIPMTLRGHPAVPAVARRQLSRPVCLMDRSEQIPEDQYGSLQQRAALLA